MSAAKLRLFVAVPVPDGVLSGIAAALDPLRKSLPSARWVPAQNQHVTLKFLGWTPPEQLDAAADVCRACAAKHRPGELSVGGLGAFPNARGARVLWVGLHEEHGLLGAVAADLEARFEALGHEPEVRGFSAHMTVARFARPHALPAEDDLPRIPAAAFACRSIVLYRSIPARSGVRYDPVGKWALGGS